VRLWVQDLSTRLGKPILLGSIAVEPDHEMQRYETFNGIFLVDPEYGLLDRYYSKRKLVPFGEYNPLSFLPWDLTMGLVGETARGGGPETLPLRVPGGELRAGPLVCYEDIFPALARQTTALGADFLFVATNNAWYGEEAGAYQHAVHSILRAVENRRPVLRCGNGGWSGWIDEYGRIAHVAARRARASTSKAPRLCPSPATRPGRAVSLFTDATGIGLWRWQPLSAPWARRRPGKL
jgi:apolipoprotein N-acyltransferase